MPRNYHLSNIRTLLNLGFSDDELRRLCFDLTYFRSLSNELAPTLTKAQITDRLIEYAERKLLMDVLLSHVKQQNPARYEQHKPYDEAQQSTRINVPKVDILFLAANPSDTTRLRLIQEFRELDQTLRRSKHGSRFNINQQWAVRVKDLQELLLRHRPCIVHFTGHGCSTGDIILENNLGNSCPVPAKALSELFCLLKDNISCVVLSACYSERQAQAIAEHIDCVIGVSSAIEELAAIRFTTGFYQALGYGKDLMTAFNLGCSEIKLESLNDSDKPIIFALRRNPQEMFLLGDY